MKIKTDANGYVTEWALIGDNGGIEVEAPDDLSGFIRNYSCYLLADGKLVKDASRAEVMELERQKAALRERRQAECFPYINRGPLWYESLTAEQRSELASWYSAWLQVTESLEAPVKLSWLK